MSFDYLLGLSDFKGNNHNRHLNKELSGRRLRLFRRKNGYTQTSLADKEKTTHSTLSAYEPGKTLILTTFAYQICMDNDISFDWLVGRSDEKTNKVKVV